MVTCERKKLRNINADGRAKFSLEPGVELVNNEGIKPKDLKKAKALCETFQVEFIQKWHEHSEMAKYIGINKSLLAKYIYGIKKPSAERMQKIKQAFHLMGQELIAV